MRPAEPSLERALALLVDRLAVELADRVEAHLAARAVPAEQGGLSVAAAAKRLNVSERHVRELIVRGELPSVKFGRRRVISEAAVTALLAGKRRTA